MKNYTKLRTVTVSGGFDPVHIGHIRLFKEAKELGSRLVVILNSDRFLTIKKGSSFMPFEERKEVLESIRYVDEVISCIDVDQTVCKTLERLKPAIFANGGDRTDKNIPELEICERYNIKLVFGVGGEKVQSSSDLINKAKNRL